MPRISRLPVRLETVEACLASPKSQRYACSPPPAGREIRMFAGLTSRWTSPRACAASSADAIWPRRPTARSGSRRPRLSQEARKVASLDVAHREEEHAVRLAGGVDRDDVRMLERRGDLRLAEEAIAEPLVARKLRSEHLERDPPLERDLQRGVDGPHRAVPEHGFDAVAGDRSPGRQVGHCATDLRAGPRYRQDGREARRRRDVTRVHGQPARSRRR